MKFSTYYLKLVPSPSKLNMRNTYLLIYKKFWKSFGIYYLGLVYKLGYLNNYMYNMYVMYVCMDVSMDRRTDVFMYVEM